MKLLKWLSVTDRFTKIFLDNQLAPMGINSSQYMYLLKICNEPGILQDSFLSSIYVHPSNIVRTIAVLEKNGFITRVPYEKDKRTSCLYPTQKALSVSDRIRDICNHVEAVLTKGLSDAEQEKFGRYLHYMGKQITKEMSIERIGDEFDE